MNQTSTARKAVIHVTPGEDRPFCVQIWTSNDGGKTFRFAGCGKHFRELDAAADYAAEITFSAR